MSSLDWENTVHVPRNEGEYFKTFFAFMDWICVSSQNLYIETPSSKVMVSGGGAFGRWRGHEGGAPMDGISVLIKEIPESSLTPPTRWGQREKTSIYEPGRESSPDAKSALGRTLHIQPPGPWEINTCGLSPPVSGIFVIAAQTN